MAQKWPAKRLREEITKNAVDHYGLLPSNFGVTIKDSRDAIKALNMFKDEDLLDFINTEETGFVTFRTSTNGLLKKR